MNACTSLSDNLDDFISHYAEPRLVAWKPRLKTALQLVTKDYHQLQQASGWLRDISDLLDKKEDQSACSGGKGKQQLFNDDTKMRQEARTKTTNSLSYQDEENHQKLRKGVVSYLQCKSATSYQQ
jgi:hypothetical protein